MAKDDKKGKKLIPFEKTRRIIRLEERGKQKQPVALTLLLCVLGVLFILYCICIMLAGGFGTYFFLVWGAMGVACILLAFLIRNRRLMEAIPGWVKGLFIGFLCAGLILFFSVEGLILSRYRSEAAPGADYCLILGAQWKPSGPSNVLRRRLDQAAVYLRENPGTVAVVSGGQGGNEPIAEALGMKEYLITAGIPEDRILVEAQSKNTYENIVFSAKLMDISDSRIVIVTNNFHVFRALKIAKKQGYRNVEGLAAGAVTTFIPNNLLREFVGVLKDFLMGNL